MGKSDAKPSQPETLIELIRALERSREIRSLARECGLTIREFRRRLSVWRRDLVAEEAAGPEGETAAAPEKRPASASGKQKGGKKEKQKWPTLTAAADLEKSPLPARGSRVLEIHTDGASKGNPGPASVGIVFSQHDGEDLCTHSEAIGRATNNVAEYKAVLIALEYCQRWRIKQVNLFMDSELVVRQLTGAYRVKSPDLLPLYQQVSFLTRRLKSFRVRHVRREHNGFADHLANLALSGSPRD